MKKALIISVIALITLSPSASEVNVYGDFQPDSQGIPKKWSLTHSRAGTVETIANNDKNMVLLSSEKKGNIGIYSCAVSGGQGDQFKVTALICGGPCEFQLLQYDEFKKFSGSQKIRFIAKKNVTELSHIFTVKDSAKRPVRSVRFAFRVFNGAGCSISNVRVEQIDGKKK